MLCVATYALAPTLLTPPARLAVSRPAVRMVANADDLSAFLVDKANISPKFLPEVLKACDEEMIGSIDNLATLQKHGMLTSVWATYLLEIRRGGTSGPPRTEEVQPPWPELHARTPFAYTS